MIAGSSLREFANDSRILEPMRNTLSYASSIFSLVEPLVRTLLAFSKLMRPPTKGVISTS
jgi:hypothetical protein